MLRYLLTAAIGLALLLPGCDDKRTTNVTVTDLSSAPVLVYAVGTVVDFFPGNVGSEGSNLVRTFESQDLRVGLLYDLTPTSLVTRLQDRRILAIPEQENGSFDAQLTAANRPIIASFVQGGGILMLFWTDAGSLAAVNSTFGLALASGATTTLPYSITVDATGTPFAGGPATLPDNDATNSVSLASLPPGSLVIYEESANGNGVVTAIPFGQGWIVLFGWDWFDAAPTGVQDGGWLDVLERASQLP